MPKKKKKVRSPIKLRASKTYLDDALKLAVAVPLIAVGTKVLKDI